MLRPVLRWQVVERPVMWPVMQRVTRRVTRLRMLLPLPPTTELVVWRLAVWLMVLRRLAARGSATRRMTMRPQVV
jgi:hypothetical protein